MAVINPQYPQQCAPTQQELDLAMGMANAAQNQNYYAQNAQNQIAGNSFNQYGGMGTTGTAITGTTITTIGSGGGGTVGMYYPTTGNTLPNYGGILGASIPPTQPSLDFTVDMIMASVEKHLRKIVREELQALLQSQKSDRDTVLAAKMGRRNGKAALAIDETA